MKEKILSVFIEEIIKARVTFSFFNEMKAMYYLKLMAYL